MKKFIIIYLSLIIFIIISSSEAQQNVSIELQGEKATIKGKNIKIDQPVIKSQNRYKIKASSVVILSEKNTLHFNKLDASYNLGCKGRQLFIRSKKATIESEKIIATDGITTICGLDDPVWTVKFNKINIDETSITLFNSNLSINNINLPLLAVPWFKFYYTRHIGLLPPDLAWDSKGGLFIGERLYIPAGENTEFEIGLNSFPVNNKIGALFNFAYKKNINFTLRYLTEPAEVKNEIGWFNLEANSYVETRTGQISIHTNLFSNTEYYFWSNFDPFDRFYSELINQFYLIQNFDHFSLTLYSEHWQMLNDHLNYPILPQPELIIATKPYNFGNNLYFYTNSSLSWLSNSFIPSDSFLELDLSIKPSIKTLQFHNGIRFESTLTLPTIFFLISRNYMISAEIQTQLSYPLKRTYNSFYHVIAPKFELYNFISFIKNSSEISELIVPQIAYNNFNKVSAGIENSFGNDKITFDLNIKQQYLIWSKSDSQHENNYFTSFQSQLYNDFFKLSAQLTFADDLSFDIVKSYASAAFFYQNRSFELKWIRVNDKYPVFEYDFIMSHYAKDADIIQFSINLNLNKWLLNFFLSGQIDEEKDSSFITTVSGELVYSHFQGCLKIGLRGGYVIGQHYPSINLVLNIF